jgi:N-acetylglucosaminyldiphosphoundecaprenol N-acetyl-beta-D-mannosaminyltransferase
LTPLTKARVAHPGQHATQAPAESAPITILGVPFDNVTTSGAIALIEQMVASGRPHYLVTPNVDFLVQAYHDVELRRILIESHLVLCDGTPLLWASRWLGNPLPERVAGSDLVPLLMRLAEQQGYKVFFLGGSPEAAALAVAKLQQNHPDLKISGHYSPPFRDLLDMDHEEIRRRIEQSRPDLLLVCFGCPKQEKWMAMHYRSLRVPVSIGVGGTIDFLAGRLARAPLWMQRSGTEWLFRLLQEPRRLFKRYVNDFWHFGRLLALQLWRMRSRRRNHSSASDNPTIDSAEGVQEIRPPDWLDAEVARESFPFWDELLAKESHRLLDLSNVRFIDSTGMGLLVKLQKRSALQGRKLVLVAPSEAAKRAIDSMRLSQFFVCARDREEARKLIGKANGQQAVRAAGQDSCRILSWQGEVTAATSEAVWAATEQFITDQPPHSELQIDLSDVRFIDSTGIGLMVRAKKRASLRGKTVRFTGAQADALNVISLARLEEYFFGRDV